MLSDAEKRWLARRTEGLRPECRRCDQMNGDRTGCTYVPPYYGEWCILEAENQDWSEACVFEARVAASMPFWVWKTIERQAGQKEIVIDAATILKIARIAVEEEMELEEKDREAWK